MTDAIIIEDVHTPEQISIETKSCIGDLKPMVTLAGFMRLADIKSPYVFGGEPTGQDIIDASYAIDNWCGLHGAEFDSALREELAAISRAFEIIQPDKGSRRSIIATYSPEWLADFMAAVADVMPSLTPDAMLHKTSMVLLVHLAAAAHRKNGGSTRRPTNAAAALEKLMELTEQEKEE